MGSVFSSFFRPAHPQLPRPEPGSERFARLGACVPLVPFDHGQVWLATGLGSCWLVEVGTVDREQTSWNREHQSLVNLATVAWHPRLVKFNPSLKISFSSVSTQQ